MEAVTNAEGKKGFYDKSTGFVSVDNMQKVTNNEGQKGYYHETSGFIPAPQEVVKEQTTAPQEKEIGWRDKESKPSRFFHGITRGITHPFIGLAQRAGLINQQDVDMAMKGMEEERQQGGTAGEIGEVSGGLLPYAAVPLGGVTGGLVRKAAVSGATGAGMGALQPTATGESVGKNIAIGGAVGAGASGLLSSIPKIGSVAKEGLGITTGAGKGAVDEAVKGSEVFKKALRGDITGSEIVETAKNALQTIKDKRASAYQDKLNVIAGKTQPLDKAPIIEHLDKLGKQYNVKFTPSGELDVSQIAMGKAGRNDIKEVMESVNNWKDTTPKGLDTLKRQLEDFYSDSSQARAFVSSLKNNISNTIKKSVPEYGEMTKGYSEASQFIKDIEKGFTGRNSSINGRIAADNTLRKLTSAMKNNSELKKDIIEAMGREGGADLSGQVAGYSMNSVMPRGLIGQVGGIGTGAMVYLHPKMWPILAISSPRVMGEFLNLYGKALRVATPAARNASKITPRAVSIMATQPSGTQAVEEGGKQAINQSSDYVQSIK